MKTRTLGAVLLVGGLTVGYLSGGNRVDAQATNSSNFPFSAGDTVRLQFELQDTGRDQTCVIESFRGTFVVCKNENSDVRVAFNLDHVIRARRTAAGWLQ